MWYFESTQQAADPFFISNNQARRSGENFKINNLNKMKW